MGVFSHFLDPIITGDHLTRQEKQKDIRGKQRERERLRGKNGVSLVKDGSQG